MKRLFAQLFTRNTFAERMLFLALAGGIVADGVVNNAFVPFGVEGIIRCIIFIGSLVLFSFSFSHSANRQSLRFSAYVAIAMLVGFNLWLIAVHNFDINNALTLLGVTIICSLYFHTLRDLLLYLLITYVGTVIVAFFIETPQIDTTTYLLRLLLGDLLIIGLSHTTRTFFVQLKQQNARISAENRQLMDQQLHLSEQLTHEQLLSLVANRANAAVIITSSADKIEWVNDTFTTITGYRADEVIGRDPAFMRGVGTDAKTVRRIEQRKLNPVPFVDEILNYRKDGTPVWIELNVSPLLDENGRVLRWIAIQEDITERKLKDEALSSSREQLNVAQQQAKIGSWVWLEADNHIQCSDELCRMLGIKDGQVITPLNFYECVHPGDREVVKRAIDNSRRRQSPFEIDNRLLVNGVVSHVFLTGQTDTANRRMIGTMQDITDRKRLEEAMQQAENQYRQLFEHSQHMICIHDMAGAILSINPAGAHAIGYEPEEMIGRDVSDFLAPEVLNDFPNYLEVLQREGANEGLLKLRRRNGSRSIWMFSNIRLNDASGQPFALCSNVEISERYQMERELREAKKTAENALVTKDRFVANISHELRTPMNAIIGFTEVLSRTQLSDEQREYISAVKIAGETLTAVIGDILDLAKIEAGKIEFSEVPFSVSETMHATYRLLHHRAEEAGLDLRWTCDEQVPSYVLGDDLRLRQILINLTGNAIKFTPAGRVEMHCTVAEAFDESLMLRFEVSDTGIGIPAEKLQHIFEPFTQASSESTRRYGGTGLGLTIVKDLVELQGGEIAVRSIEGEGAQFIVRLPVKRVSTAVIDQVELALNPLADPANIHILLVEDHPLNQQLARKLITDFGFKVEVANHGAEALQLLQQTEMPFDLVLMDLHMPVLDGYETTLRIRNDLHLTLPIIALTAHSSFGERERCLELGMNDYLSKPFRSRDLYFRISKALGGSAVEPVPVAVDADALRNPLQMLAAGNIGFEREMLQLMQQSVPGDVLAIVLALEEHNVNTIKTTAHRLKSTVSLAGDRAFAELLQQIERSQSTADAEVWLKQLEIGKARLLAQINIRLTELDSETPS